MSPRFSANEKRSKQIERNNGKMSVKRTMMFSLLPLVLLFIFGELILRAYFYQQCGTRHLAWSQGFSELQDKIVFFRVGYVFKENMTPNEEREFNYLLFNDEEGGALLEEYFSEYERNFRLLVGEAESLGVKLLVLYIPLPISEIPADAPSPFMDFIRSLTAKYKIELIDLRSRFGEHLPHETSLLPEDDHLSRFGNSIVANALAGYLDRYKHLKVSFSFPDRPALLGDLPSSTRQQWRHLRELPYLVTVNKQGLRMTYDLSFPKRKQRILLLGDSLTFGPYLPDVHTYPVMLEALLKDREVINAGVFGYTITDEVEIFQERAKYIEPDIVVLQVFDNDILGLSSYMKNIFDRKKRSYQPSRLEKRLKERAISRLRG